MTADSGKPTIPQWIREQMHRKGWNQTQLAHQLNVAPSTVSRLLATATEAPSLETIKGLSVAFDTPVSEILEMVERPRPPEPQPDDGGSGVLDALAADPSLTASDRRFLIDMYRRLSHK
jgi:transcriptional regulator with XRE-family HTH domain